MGLAPDGAFGAVCCRQNVDGWGLGFFLVLFRYVGAPPATQSGGSWVLSFGTVLSFGGPSGRAAPGFNC